MDPLLAPLLQAGASGWQNILNLGSTVLTNKANRKFAREQYDTQRRDTLADYHMQNDYNSPANQMKRFKEAGLNPNLIYKQTNEGGTVRSTNLELPKAQAPTFDLSGIGSSLSSYMDTELKQAQVDNLKAANNVAIQDAALRAAQVAATGVQTKRSQFELNLAEELRLTSLETAKQQLSNLKSDQYVRLSENERQAALNAQSLKEGAERILNLRLQRAKTEEERNEIRARINSIDKDVKLKELDIELKKNGIQPSDSIWWRILGRIIGDKLDLSNTPD